MMKIIVSGSAKVSQEPAITATAADYSPVRPLTSSGGVPTIGTRCAEGAFSYFGLVL